MFEKNVHKILSELKEDDSVLDVGGWFRPFNRANWVVDVMPYGTKGAGGVLGAQKEYFTQKTYIQRDLCAREPLPFPDKTFDFVICSHTLEDVRDPLFLCSEIIRVGKRGYIETPSLEAELAFGTEARNYAGYFHHRWLIQIQKNKLTFIFKPHFIHGRWKYHFPASYGRRLTEKERVQWLFWENSFNYEERPRIECSALMCQIEDFVRVKRAYPPWRYKIELLREYAKKLRDSVFQSTRRYSPQEELHTSMDLKEMFTNSDG